MKNTILISTMTKQYAKRLLGSNTESEVTTLLDELARTYDVDWNPIGGQENNYGVVENQSSSPLGALNEILSNGIDAVLRRRYKEKYGGQYKAKHEITSYADGQQRLLNGHEEIRIIADGQKGKGGPTNITIADTGEGQPPDKFEDTFVGLLKPGEAKQGWPFLQGQFGMGSTAVLPHCGKQGYKAIFSSSFKQQDTWTWTVIRRNRSGNAYEYLRLDGDVPKFTGDFGDKGHRSYVKMFNYDLPVHSNITSGLRYKFARTMTEVPVPVMLDERRDYQSAVMEANLLGFKQIISSNAGMVKRRETRSYDFGGEIGTRDVELVVFKEDSAVKENDDLSLKDKQRELTSRRKQRKRAIFFTVNGQVHGDLGLSFIKNRCDKYHIAKDTVAIVDFSDLGPAQLTDIFTPARDRLHDKPMANRLKSGMEDLVTNDPMLKEEEQRRREQFTKDKRDEKIGDMLDDLVGRNPNLIDYLEGGDKVTTSGPGDVSRDADYTAPFFPDTFKIIESKHGDDWTFYEDDERYEIELPVNRNGWIGFYLNAQNDFFTRDDQPGQLVVEPQESVKSWGLSDGLLSIQVKPLEAATPGMTMPVTVRVEGEGMESLQQLFNVEYVEPADENGSDRENAVPPVEQLDFPPIVPVWEDEWEDVPEPFDKDTPVRLAGSGEDMQIYVNYDAAPIKDFLSRYNLRKTGKETVRETWKVGVALYALSTYIEIDEEFDGREIDSSHMAEVSMRGIVQSMLDQQVSQEELEALTV